MKVQSVLNQEYSRKNLNFGAKKFRLPIDVITKQAGFDWYSEYSLGGKWVREYDNPNAESIYKKAQKVKNVDEKLTLLKQMGDYQLKNISLKERLIDLYDRLCSKLL